MNRAPKRGDVNPAKVQRKSRLRLLAGALPVKLDLVEAGFKPATPLNSCRQRQRAVILVPITRRRHSNV
jgi:hypothetical protein